MRCQGHEGKELVTPNNTPGEGMKLPRPCPSPVSPATQGGVRGTLGFFGSVSTGNSSEGCTTDVISHHVSGHGEVLIHISSHYRSPDRVRVFLPIEDLFLIIVIQFLGL